MSSDRFYTDFQDYLDGLLELIPVTATQLGDHRFDQLLSDHSQEGLDKSRAYFADWLERFASWETREWTLDAQIDHMLTVQLCKYVLREHDKLQYSQRLPGGAVDECLNGVYQLIIREFAPLPERMRNIQSRLGEVPRVLEQDRTVIEPLRVPKVWAELALESAESGLGLFTGFVPALAQATPELKAKVEEAAAKAGEALKAHAAWIESEILPRAKADFAVGRELFDEILREDHMVDYDAQELLAIGEKRFQESNEKLTALATEIDSSKTVSEILEAVKADHPPAEGLLDAYRQAMAQARRFVMDHEIVSIPEGEHIRVEPTPEFIRAIIPYAAYMPPGFLEAGQDGIFIVTPVEEGASAEEIEAKLRGHPRADIPVTALHEAYPGHHLQFAVANTIDSLPRKLGGFLSTMFIEGWAFYCEELMEELGFIGSPAQRLARLQADRWRAARIILDSSLHTGGMDIEAAIEFLVDRVELEPRDAKAEVRRYTFTPAQPQSYMMGKLQLLEIVEEYRRRFPERSLRDMHDHLLTSGALPSRLMRKRLFSGAKA